MRKLKTLLILMFAASLSLTLFACGGGNKDKDKDGSGTLYRLSGDEEIVLDDSTDQNAWNTYLQSYQFTGQTDEGDRIKIKGSDCDVTHNIDFATPDRYVATFKPKENNPDGLTLDVNVVITHTWVDGDEDGVQVCSKDGAKLTTKDEDVVMHYGGFHYGTGDGPLGSVPEIGTVLPKITLNAEEAEALGLNAEAGNGAVFNNDAGITGKDSSGRITNFGVDGRNGKTVPTITAGDLTPGMSITIEGYAKTDAGWDMDNPTGPWNVKNGNWNAPSYGIADPYSTLSSTNNVGGIDVGAAVIVRSEGWVLYNGIGDANSVNVLGGLPAFVEGTGAYGKESGSTDTANYGSHTSDNGEKWPTNFDPAKRPAFTSADWKTWWVYSEGQDRHSLDSYGTQPAVTDDNPDTRSTYVPVRVTWTYRTYRRAAPSERSSTATTPASSSRSRRISKWRPSPICASRIRCRKAHARHILQASRSTRPPC